MSAPEIVTEINGRSVTRGEVLAWEDRRITAVARKLGVRVPRSGVTERREALLQAKRSLGAEKITARLNREMRIADATARLEARLSPRRRISSIDIYVRGGSAETFVDAFERWTQTSDEPAMLRACPDHFLIRTGADRRQQVLETTGGSPFAALFLIDYDDVSSLVTPADTRFPHQIAGVARASDGFAIGGVRHQFRDTDDGFHARLTVEFALPTLGRMVAGHRWHLACEFSNWIEAALEQPTG
ncbi:MULTISPECIES: hypothetical protein [unclassified Mycobacterium]|uniref:hypothetical protein n=1 Tax=unclassified Mycobacterium TaxID=2642494 RepID=UPI0007401F58|nr:MULTISPECIES: hypothetical protein [unclassified Mycobacterium]KUH88154.1 hypothetical protein AU186_09595 [Mycobacterium sp. GA-1999]KUH89463.1 hypothetical protein AU185_14395 [Mycobacterium sp. GA-0227b]